MLEALRDGIAPMLLEPAWGGIEDPIEKIFALFGAIAQHCRERLHLWLPDRSLALELHEPDPQVREMLAANFEALDERIEQCLARGGFRLPAASIAGRWRNSC